MDGIPTVILTEQIAAGAKAQRALPTFTRYFVRMQGRHRLYELDEKTELLKHLDAIHERIWKEYAIHLERITPLERAESHRAQMEQTNLKSICALARAVGKDESGIRQYLNLLKLPEPIQQHLKENRTPANVRYFSEKRLRPLLKLDARSAWRRFQAMLAEAQQDAGIWQDAK